MSQKLKTALKVGVVALVIMPSISHAFIDEREPAPEPSALRMAPMAPPPAPVPTVAREVVNHFQPSQPISFSVGADGDFTNPQWLRPHVAPLGNMPLADALIALYVPVFNKAVEINAEPFMLDRNITLAQGLSRKASVDSIAKQMGVHIRHDGNEVTVLTLDETDLNANFREVDRGSQGSSITVVEAESSAKSGEVVVVKKVKEVESPVVMPVIETKTWVLKEGDMLSTSMLKWANEWGWRLIWKAEVDYRIAAAITLNKDFLGGVEEILSAYSNADRPLWGDWNENQRVLVVNEPNYVNRK